MKLTQKKLTAAIAAVSSATVLSIASLAWAAPEVTLGSNAMTASVENADSVYVRIAGPNGYFTELRGSSIAQWAPDADAPDGDYRYDSYTTATSEGAEKASGNDSSRKSGMFSIEGGVIVAPQPSSIPLEESSLDTKNIFEKAMISLLDSLIPTANAANLIADSANPVVIFEDTTTADGDDWRIFGLDGATGRFLIEDHVGAGVRTVLAIHSSPNSIDSIIVNDNSGDMTLAGSAVFIDRSADSMGIGTTTPARQLELSRHNPAIVLRDIDGTAWTLNEDTISTRFDITHEPSAGGTIVSPFKINTGATDDTLTLTANGIGIGTNAPESALHVLKQGAKLIVEDTTAAVGIRNVIELKNNGGVGFVLRDTNLDNAWDFRTAGNGGFLVSNIGVPGSKFQINLDGRVFMGGGVFDLKPDGTMTVTGNSNALLHVNTSSRESKTDFEPINPQAVMKKIKAMDVSEWRYKDSAAPGRHIGPVAEDFYSLFKLGADNKHIAASDIASIALIAAKELQRKAALANIETVTLKAENKALRKKLEEKTTVLESKNDRLQERLASLEKLVTNLASADGNLDGKGKQVALK